MLPRKIPKSAVIHAQNEVIQAQDALIEWLLKKVESQPKKSDSPKPKDR
jgi:hypothetical protein